MKKAVLEITLHIAASNRPQAAEIYAKYKQPFLATIQGAESKELLLRDEDVQVLHRFDSRVSAAHYLESDLFGKDVVRELQPHMQADPDIRIYEYQ